MILDEVARAPFVTSDSDNGGVQTTTVLDTKTINLAADARAKGGVEGHDSAHNLIHFFKSEGMGGAAVPLSTEKAVRSSKALADARPLGREDAVRFVEFWAKVGHIKL